MNSCKKETRNGLSFYINYNKLNIKMKVSLISCYIIMNKDWRK